MRLQSDLLESLQAQCRGEQVRAKLGLGRNRSPYCCCCPSAWSSGCADWSDAHSALDIKLSRPWLMLRCSLPVKPLLQPLHPSAAASPTIPGRPPRPAAQQVKLEWSSDPSLTVVLAAKGYPGSYAKGGPIRNLEAVTVSPLYI